MNEVFGDQIDSRKVLDDHRLPSDDDRDHHVDFEEKLTTAH